MPLGNRAEDYGVVLSATESGAVLETQGAYDAYRDGLEPAWLQMFHTRFYEVRAAWSARDPEAWLALMEPYPAFLELLRRRAGDVELAIATAKDGASVAALLGRYGVADLFPTERILDKETGVSKQAHLRALAERLACPLPELTFVDDKVNHLESVAELGVRCALAAWGYNGPREQRRARDCGFPVLTLGDVEAQLFPDC
jgi:phosphoglycolate phosphatase-like HAD superfamily hydrolase